MIYIHNSISLSGTIIGVAAFDRVSRVTMVATSGSCSDDCWRRPWVAGRTLLEQLRSLHSRIHLVRCLPQFTDPDSTARDGCRRHRSGCDGMEAPDCKVREFIFFSAIMSRPRVRMRFGRCRVQEYLLILAMAAFVPSLLAQSVEQILSYRKTGAWDLRKDGAWVICGLALFCARDPAPVSKRAEPGDFPLVASAVPRYASFSVADANGHVVIKTRSLVLELEKSPYFRAVFKNSQATIFSKIEFSAGTMSDFVGRLHGIYGNETHAAELIEQDGADIESPRRLVTCWAVRGRRARIGADRRQP